jgi:hypothetical protein
VILAKERHEDLVEHAIARGLDLELLGGGAHRREVARRDHAFTLPRKADAATGRNY